MVSLSSFGNECPTDIDSSPVVEGHAPSGNYYYDYVEQNQNGTRVFYSSLKSIYQTFEVRHYPLGTSIDDVSQSGIIYTTPITPKPIAPEGEVYGESDLNRYSKLTIETGPRTCPLGYTISHATGMCNLTDPAACETVVEPEICNDGFPANTGEYQSCDRPDLKQCDTGEFVEKEGGICPLKCNDYQSCYDYALSKSSCSISEEFSFYYQDTSNFTYSCLMVDPDSPDHPENGGNGDGDPTNDPNSPNNGGDNGSGDGEQLPSFTADELSKSIDDALNDDFVKLDDSLNGINQQSKLNSEGIELEIGGASLDNINSNNLLGDRLTDSLSEIKDSIDELSGGNESGQCNPNSKDYLECLGSANTSMPPSLIPESGAKNLGEAGIMLYNRIANAPIVQSFSSFSHLITLNNAQCPIISFDLPPPINETVGTDIHCELFLIIEPIISAVMLVIYAWLGFRIFASS
ncbi:hypothetical protein AYJ58_13160 [Shewanella sp. Pdp11]|nr:hypothetical protein AYJ58_13115 [Shewanella sp. Pdp11]AUD60374.1 hypothetical protein AYJ58_13160 [Shewanella sp. Pdp11]